MRGAPVFLAVLAVLAITGCGGDEPRERAQTSPTPTATTTPSPTPAASTKPARSDAQCLRLWNTLERAGTAGQTSPADTLIELAADGRVRASVIYAEAECLLIAGDPDDETRGYLFVAEGGAGPWSTPTRLDFDREFGKGQTPRFNAVATTEGRIRPLR